MKIPNSGRVSMSDHQQNYAAILEDIKAALKPLQPYKVILFGSYADGTADSDSDLDLLIVLDAESVPQSFAEKMNLQSKVARRLRHIRRRVPMDLVVQTRPMYRRFVTNGGMFAREIEQSGEVLYENSHSRVA